MSHLTIHIVQNRCAIRDPGKLLASIDADQFARIPSVGEIISLDDGEYKVERVSHMPNHGATLTVIG